MVAMHGLKLIVGWVFSLVLVVGPWAAAMIWWPGGVPGWFHVAYPMAMFIYIAAAATMTPDYDSTNLGWAGGLIDNPFSFEDDFNRFGLGLTILLIPGKVVCWTLAVTWALLFGRSG